MESDCAIQVDSDTEYVVTNMESDCAIQVDNDTDYVVITWSQTALCK